MNFVKLAAVAVAGLLAAAPAQAQQANWPKSMTLGTASIGGVFAVYGQVCWGGRPPTASMCQVGTLKTTN